jgi:hypothetical protein
LRCAKTDCRQAHGPVAVLDERVEHVALNLIRIETLTADVLILWDIP